MKFECPGRDDFEETQPGEGHLHWLRQATCNGPLLGYFNGLFVAYEMCINHSDYISIAGEILISFPGNSLEPLVVFEQVYWTCLRMTDPFQSDMGCRYPLKLFNIISTVYCILPIQFNRFMIRWCRQKCQRRQRPKTIQASF